MRNYFTFDGVDSRSFGVYISGQGTFKAPARSYDAIEIPGRNGALLGIENRLGNVELTYPAFIYSNFKENVAAFRAFLLSHKGYFKLKDSYHPEEYRMAYFPGPFEPDVTSANNAGSFDITFICKPQRYLESGEEVIELIPGQSETHTYTGNPASFVALGGDQITSLQIPLRFFQNLHGYDHPWPAGGGVNKFGGSLINGFVPLDLPVGTYTVSADRIDSSQQTHFYIRRAASGTTTYEDVAKPIVGSNVSPKTFAVETGYDYYAWANQTYSNVKDVQIQLGSTATAYEPYENICPISGLTGLSVYVSPTQDPDDATVYNAVWSTQAGTVYHGTVDLVAGQLTADWIYKEFNGTEAWSAASNYLALFGQDPSKSNTDMTQKSNIFVAGGNGYADYNKFRAQANGAVVVGNKKEDGTVGRWANAAAFKSFLAGLYSAGTPFAVCYELATPLTYQLTPTQIAALLAGETFVWSSNNEVVTVEVSSVIPTIIENPTLFDALPFLRVYGTGILGIGSHTITITAADVYTDIDCEMMDCFKGSANKNQYVQFSGNDFPTLEPGVNGFSFSGITKVEVKPRWWSV